jgi:hypothetical protein
MPITRYYTETEARAAVIADGGDPSCNVRWFYDVPSWEARTGSDRNYPPPVYKNSRTITAQLTPTERANIFAAALANPESAAGIAVSVIPVPADVEFDVAEATPFLEQLVNEGLLTPARAIELLT